MAASDTCCTLVPCFKVNPGATLQEALKIAQVTRLEVHAPPAELGCRP